MKLKLSLCLFFLLVALCFISCSNSWNRALLLSKKIAWINNSEILFTESINERRVNITNERFTVKFIGEYLSIVDTNGQNYRKLITFNENEIYDKELQVRGRNCVVFKNEGQYVINIDTLALTPLMPLYSWGRLFRPYISNDLKYIGCVDTLNNSCWIIDVVNNTRKQISIGGINNQSDIVIYSSANSNVAIFTSFNKIDSINNWNVFDINCYKIDNDSLWKAFSYHDIYRLDIGVESNKMLFSLKDSVFTTSIDSLLTGECLVQFFGLIYSNHLKMSPNGERVITSLDGRIFLFNKNNIVKTVYEMR